MKLLFIAPSAYLLGGVQDWLITTTLGLRNRGHDVLVGVPDGEFHNGKEFNNYYLGLNAYFFRNKSGTPEGRIRALEDFLRSKEVDIIIGVNIGDLFEVISRLHKSGAQPKFVMTLHAIEANYFADIKCYNPIIDAVITTNKLTQKMVVRIGCVEKKNIYYAPYGINIKKDQSLCECVAEAKIVWVGRLENNQKRVADLLQIVQRLDTMRVPYSISIAGDGPFKSQLEQDLSPWLSNGRIHFCGVLSKNDLRLLYKQHNILLITSEWETGPIVAWEGIDSGLTIVSSRYIGVKEENTLIHGKTALMFDVGDSEQAAVQIARLLDPLLRQYLQKNAQDIVSYRYSMQSSLDAWENSFRAIINQPVIERAVRTNTRSNRAASGRLERFIGLNLSEQVRSLLPQRKLPDAGSEWPHSLQGICIQRDILDYARQIENTF